MLACMESPHPGRHHDDGRVGGRRDLDLHLADADGLDDHDGHAGRAEQPDGVGHGERQPAQVPAGRHRADEHRRVERVLPMRTRSPRMAPPLKGDVGSTASTPPGRTRPPPVGPAAARRGDQAVGQRRLARAGRAGQPDVKGDVGPVGQPRHRRGRLAAPLDEGEQAGQRHPVARPGAVRAAAAGSVGTGAAHRRVTLAPSERSAPARSS